MKFVILWIITLHTFTALATTKLISQDSLQNFRWQHRLLITQIDSKNELIKLQNEVQRHNNDFSDRRLLLLIHINDKTWILNESTTHSVSLLLSNEVLKVINQNLDKVILIGLDGGIKNRFPAKTFNLKQVFNEIDLMPMRRWEIDG